MVKERENSSATYADALAIRYVVGPAGEESAIALARSLVERLAPGEAASAELLRDLAPTGVDLVAQNLSGEVVQHLVS